MPEEKNVSDAGTPAQEPSAGELELRAELARVRSRGKLLKIVLLGVSAVLIVIFIFAFVVYRKISQAKEMLDGFSEGFAAPAKSLSSGSRAIPSPFRVTATSASAAGSGLAFFSMPGGGVPDGGSGPAGAPAVAVAARGFNPADIAKGKQILSAMNRYSDRPIVRDFLAELSREPEYAKAKKAQKAGNPFAMLAVMQKSPLMKNLMAKYSQRPDFMPLMMEFMQDPEIRPLMGGAPGGRAQVPGGRAAPSAIPSAPAAAPARRPAAVTPPPEEDPDIDGDGELTFNSEAVSGPGQPARKPVRKPARKIPPPVDNGQ